MSLLEKIGYASLASILTIVLAALFPSNYTLAFSATITTLTILILAFLILKDTTE